MTVLFERDVSLNESFVLYSLILLLILLIHLFYDKHLQCEPFLREEVAKMSHSVSQLGAKVATG
jgi:hypothetical protein